MDLFYAGYSYACIQTQDKNYSLPETTVRLASTYTRICGRIAFPRAGCNPSSQMRRILGDYLPHLSSKAGCDTRSFLKCGTHMHERAYGSKTKITQSLRPLSRWCQYYIDPILFAQGVRFCHRVEFLSPGVFSHLKCLFYTF